MFKSTVIKNIQNIYKFFSYPDHAQFLAYKAPQPTGDG